MDLRTTTRDRDEYIASLEKVIAAQQARIGELLQMETRIAELTQIAALVPVLQARIAELERRLSSNSRTSSKPPSSDGYGKPPAKSRKSTKGSRPPGKQPGSAGTHLARRLVPDVVVIHRPQLCAGCGEGLADADVVATEARQVFDIPPMQLTVTEHRAQAQRCGCGHTTFGSFPAAVTAPTQYGPHLRALGTYLSVYQHLPYERTAELLADWLGAPVATGTLVNMVADASDRVEPALVAIRDQIAASDVVHADETGARVDGRLNWMHSASTTTHTLFTAHPRRGLEAMTAAGVLAKVSGVLVHDGWSPYRRYEVEHGLCNAHHLRELEGAAQYRGQAGWARQMIRVLTGLKREVDGARRRGAAGLDEDRLAHWNQRYDSATARGTQANHVRLVRKPNNLLKRLITYRADVLRFATDFRVPFDNNLAERDIRMVKLKQKVSGCHRSAEGADRFCRIRSYISTARKQGQSVATVLVRLFEGDPWLPAGPAAGAPT